VIQTETIPDRNHPLAWNHTPSLTGSFTDTDTSAKSKAFTDTVSLPCVPAFYTSLFLLREHPIDDFFPVTKNSSPLSHHSPADTAHVQNALSFGLTPCHSTHAHLHTGTPRERCTKLLQSWKQPCHEISGTRSRCFLKVTKHKQKQNSSKPVLHPSALLTSWDVKLTASYLPVVHLLWKWRFLSRPIQTFCISERLLLSDINEIK